MNVNKVILIGYLGKEPFITTSQNGSRIAMFSLATTESWKDKKTGEKKQQTTWHNVVVTNSSLADISDRYLKKGSFVYVEGTLRNREVTKGTEKFQQTDIVVGQFDGDLKILDSKQ